MKKHEIIQDALTKRGGPGSGHYGHAGRTGHQGGSLPGKTAMSLKTGKTAGARQAAANGGWTQKGDMQTRVGGGMRATITPDGDKSKLTVIKGETRQVYDNLTEEEALQKGNGEFIRSEASKAIPDIPVGKDIARVVDVDEPSIGVYNRASDVAKAIQAVKGAPKISAEERAAMKATMRRSKQLSTIINLLTKRGNMPWWLKTATIIGVIAAE